MFGEFYAGVIIFQDEGLLVVFAGFGAVQVDVAGHVHGMGCFVVWGQAGSTSEDVVVEAVVAAFDFGQAGEFGGVGFMVGGFAAELGVLYDSACEEIVDIRAALGDVEQGG